MLSTVSNFAWSKSFGSIAKANSPSRNVSTSTTSSELSRPERTSESLSPTGSVSSLFSFRTFCTYSRTRSRTFIFVHSLRLRHEQPHAVVRVVTEPVLGVGLFEGGDQDVENHDDGNRADPRPAGRVFALVRDR